MKRSLISLAVVAVFATGCSSFGNKTPQPVVKVENKLEQKPDIIDSNKIFNVVHYNSSSQKMVIGL